MPPVLPSVSNNALGARPRAQRQRPINTYTPIVPESGGEGLARAGKEVADTATTMLDEVVRVEQNNQLKQAQINYSSQKLSILEEYELAKGQDALNQFGDVHKRLREAREATLENLSGQVAQNFDLWSQAEELGARSRAKSHIARERIVVQDTNSLAFIEQRQGEIISNPNDAAWVQARELQITRETLAMADRKGVTDKNARELLIRQNLSKAHTAAIDSLLGADQADEAAAYFKDHRAAIDPTQVGAIETKILGRKAIIEGQGAADYAINSFENEDEALAWARKKYEGVKEEAAVKSIKERYGELEAGAQRRGQAAALEIVGEEGVTETEALTRAQETYAGKVLQQAEISIKSHFAALERQRRVEQRSLRAAANEKAQEGRLDTLTQEERDAVNASGFTAMANLEKVNEAAISGTPLTTHEPTRQKLMRMVRDRPLLFAELDLYGGDYAGTLSKTDLQYFEKLQISVNKQDEASKRNSRVMGVLRGIGKSASLSNSQMDTLSWEVLQRIDIYDVDRKVTDREIQEMAYGLLLQGEIDQGGLFDPDRRAYEADSTFSMGDFTKENEATVKKLDQSAGFGDIEFTTRMAERLVRRQAPITGETLRAEALSAVDPTEPSDLQAKRPNEIKDLAKQLGISEADTSVLAYAAIARGRAPTLTALQDALSRLPKGE